MSKKLLNVFKGIVPEAPPLWMMRQAGRYLPEYRKIRDKHEFLEMVRNPALAAEITLQPIKRFGFDGAILFSDILVIPEAMGMKLNFFEGKGPVFDSPVKTSADVTALNGESIKDKLDYVASALKLIKRTMPPDTTLLGFAGAPFTLACYMIEGQSSKEFIKIKSFMYQQETAFHALMEKLSDALVDFIDLQIHSGAEVIQLFDTFGGILSPSDYQRYCLKHTRLIFSRIKEKHPDTPLIYFAKGGRNLYHFIKDFTIDGVGIDWMTSLEDAAKLPFVVQGNLDPLVLFSDKKIIDREVMRIKAEAKNAKGHIFNLGHGILPLTPVKNVEILCDAVRNI